MYALKVLEIEKLLERYEGVLRKGVKAARIFPELLNGCEGVSNRYHLLRELRDLGVEEVALDLEAERVDNPYPPEVLAVMRVASKYSHWYPDIWKGDGVAYVYLFATNFSRRYYAVVPYREWPRLIGEPDLNLRGLKAYSVEEFIEYLGRCREYCKAVYDWLYSEETLQDVLKQIEKAGNWAERAKFVAPLGDFRRDFFDRHLIVRDEGLRSKGVKVVKSLPFDYRFNWIERPGDETLYYVIRDDEARELEKRYRVEAEKGRRKEKLFENVWKNVLEKGRISDKLVKVSLEDLEKVLEASNPMDRDRIVEALRRLCDVEEIYLQKSGYKTPYGNAGLSIYYPLRMLYLVRRLRELDFWNVSIFEKKDQRIKDAPSLLISIDEGFYTPRDGYWKILVKPKKNLKVEYPCEAKWENGCIVIVDKSGLEKALAETR